MRKVTLKKINNEEAVEYIKKEKLDEESLSYIEDSSKSILQLSTIVLSIYLATFANILKKLQNRFIALSDNEVIFIKTLLITPTLLLFISIILLSLNIIPRKYSFNEIDLIEKIIEKKNNKIKMAFILLFLSFSFMITLFILFVVNIWINKKYNVKIIIV